MKPYLTTTGKKQGCRERLVGSIREHVKEPKRIGTLPAEESLCAKMFASEFPGVSILGLENVTSVYEKIVPVPGMTLVKQDLREWVAGETMLTCSYPSREDTHFDAFYFDFCCAPNPAVLRTICEFVANDRIVHPRKPFVFSITFCHVIRDAKLNKAFKTYLQNQLALEPEEKIEYNVQNVAALVQHVVAGATDWRSLRVVDSDKYRSTNTSVGMLFMTLAGTKR